MATIHGVLESIDNIAEGEPGSVEIALCGYGSFIPRAASQALFARPSNTIQADADGNFTTDVIGNDEISPAGTYYTVTVKDSNGDVVQVNAYVFEEAGDYDLSTIPPYDPNQPPPPLPYPILNMLLIVGAADRVIFDGNSWLSFKITLTTDVNETVFQNMKPGNLYTFIIVQDGVGSHVFNWAANVRNPTPVKRTAGSTTVQTFVADDIEDLIAISSGTYQ